MKETVRWYCGLVCMLSVMAGCTSDGSHQRLESPTPLPESPADEDLSWTPGIFDSPTKFANQCENPRQGRDPHTGEFFPDRAGTAMHEKMWLRSVANSVYLWYDQLQDPDPRPYSVAEYFNDVLRIEEDQYHYIQPYEDFIAATEEGISVDYGILWEIVEESPGYSVYVQKVEASARAATQISRGDKLLEVDGSELATLRDAHQLIAPLFPQEAGETHSFTIQKNTTGQIVETTLTAEPVAYQAVPQVKTLETEQGRIGYIEFYSHDQTAESALIDAVQHLGTEGIDDLIVDFRYNRGGQISTASQFAYMVAGSAQTAGRVFERFQFNDKFVTTDPFGDPVEPVPFISSSIGATDHQESLPTLNLSRVVVLTGPDTCSASESFINGLRGIDVEVIQIGSTTCGKPYGYRPVPNCGMVYYMVMFTGVNDKGFGDYFSGFEPSGSSAGDGGSLLPGCALDEDVRYELGTIDEPLLAAGLQYLATGSCPEVNTSSDRRPVPLQLKSVPVRPGVKQL